MNLGIKVYRVSPPLTSPEAKKKFVSEGSGLFSYSSYPKLYIKNESVKIEQLDSSMSLVLFALNLSSLTHNLPGLIITSGNDFSQHRVQSLHYENKAIDISNKLAISRAPVPRGFILKDLKDYLLSLGVLGDYDICEEVDHIHIEYDPKEKKTNKTTPNPTSENINTESNPVYVTEPIRYFHTNLKIKTLTQLLETSLLFSVYKDKREDFLSYKGGTPLSNRDRIESRYNREGESFDLLKTGTELFLDPNLINTDFLTKYSEAQVIDTADFPMFYTKVRQEIEESKGYVPKYLFKSTEYSYPVEYINSAISVWVYSKSEGQIFDISDFCNLITTSTSPVSSGFHLSCLYFETSIFETLYGQQENYLLSGIGKTLHPFQKVFSSNDIVWIRFEQLKDETDREKQSFLVNESELAGKVYDFIGLIDNISPSVSPGQSQGSITIAGRDLSKLFIDDDALFFPLSVVKDSLSGNLMIGQSDNDKLIKRNFSTGQYMTLFSQQFRTIEDSLKFYLNQLSNIGLIPDAQNETFFGSYGDRRTRIYTVKGAGQPSNELHNGIYQIIKLQIDPALKSRTVADATITNPKGSIISLFNKICVPPLVELFFDTYGDTYNIVVRKPPFDKKSIKSWVEENSLSEIYKLPYESVRSEELVFESDFYTWFEMRYQGVFYGSENGTDLTYIPIISLPEYVDIWGSKKMNIESNYIVSSTIGSEPEKKQAVLDLLYAIECSVYLPFSRKGTITLNCGDRRIKRGTWIEYEKTGEIFYIDSVVNSASISDGQVLRSTTLQVSRGLLKKYIEPVEIEGKKISYFNLVDFEGLRETVLQYLKVNEDRGSIIRKVIVDKDNFDFFLKKRQFYE